MIIDNEKKISAIVALRGIAVVAVVLYHYSWFVHPLESTFLRRGYIGVDIFFIISGFLACHTTVGSGSSLSTTIRYISKRLIRILPAYYIVTLLYVVTDYIMNSTRPDFWVLVKSLLFIAQSPEGGPSYGSPIVSVGWTLNYEFFFT